MQQNKNFVRNILDVFLVGFLAFFFVMYLKSTPLNISQQSTVMEVQTPTSNVEDLGILSPKPELLLPDLAIQVPKTLYVQGNGKNKRLRFDTTFVNLGPGALEIIGHEDPESGKTHATQYIFAKGTPGEYRDIGSFVLHPTHNHWHVENHVRYQLWTSNEQGTVGDVVSDTGKMSFCIWDQRVNDLELENASKTSVYGFPCVRNTQGMSVGWADRYEANVDEQELDISEVSDGEYLLTFDVNPDHQVLEKDYTNNRGIVRIKIVGNRITRL